MQPQAIAQGGKAGNLKSRRGERQAGGKGRRALLVTGSLLTAQSWGNSARALLNLFSATELGADEVS